jgi:Ca-activated chloride channel family protein
MPVEGKNAAEALGRAESMLARDDTPGSILFLTDGIPAEQRPAFVAHARRGSDSLLVLGVGTSEGGPIRAGDGGFVTDPAGGRVVARLDRDGLLALGREAGAFVATVTLDDRDVRRLQGRIQSQLKSRQQADAAGRWRDEGYTLVLPVALLAALWFRRGWSVRWAGLVTLAMLAPAPAYAQDNAFLDLWLTPDQQGRRHFERGEYATAAERFRDPMWKGLACYRAEDWDCAIETFAMVDTAEAFFNLGNAYARSERHELAVEAYDQALARRPEWVEARENRELVASLIPKEPEESDEGPPGDPSFEPDEIRFDEKGEKGKRGDVDQMSLTAEQMGEIWLRGLQTSPADFLRFKFAFQAQQREGGQR